MSLDLTSAVAVRKALKQLGITTSTPGLKGNDRHNELRQRLQANLPSQQPPDTGRSTTSTFSTTSSRLDTSRSTLTELKAELDVHHIDTRTPGLRGQERKDLLEQRLAEALQNAELASFDTDSVELEAPTSTGRNATTSRRHPNPRQQQHHPHMGQRSVDRSGSYTSRTDTATTTTPTPITSTTSTTSPTRSSIRPASSPGLRKPPEMSQSTRAPWAVRTRVGRGRGRSRGACRGVSASRLGRGGRHRSAGTGRRTNSTNSQRRPLTEVGQDSTTTRTPRQHDVTPRGTRGQPPVSARLTARLTAVESLHTEASEELDDATKECDDEERQAQQVREELATVRNAREAAVALRSDPNHNPALSRLVEQLDGTRKELKALYNHQR